MKKLYYLIVIVLISSLVLTGCFLSNVGQVPTNEQSEIINLTKGSSSEITLWAGQNIDVGEVQIWNDDTYLYIKYLIDEPGWYLTETHLHVACSEPEIPQNKKGNPTPGHFEYSSEHEIVDYVTEYLLDPIPLNSIDCCDPVIAAHAVVCKLSDVITETLVSSDTETECAGYTIIDPSVNPLDPLNYEGTWNPAVDLSGSLPSTWYSENTSPFSGAFWISSADIREGSGLDDQYRLFSDMFEIPTGAVNRQGKLWMSADNDAIAYLDDVTNVVGEIEDVYTDSPSGNANPFNVPHDYEFTPGQGSNTLYFVVRNWAWGGSNPTGLLYKMDYEYQLLECESAWGAGTRFVEQGNWATYFTYEIQPVLLDTVEVTPYGTAAYTPTPTYSNIVLEAGKNYSLRASSTYRFANWGEYGIADAAWNYRRAANAPGGVAGWYQQASQRLQVWIGGEAVAWQPTEYNPEHIYTLDVTGAGDELMFTIVDDAYGDNSGFITVEIWWECSTP